MYHDVCEGDVEANGIDREAYYRDWNKALKGMVNVSYYDGRWFTETFSLMEKILENK